MVYLAIKELSSSAEDVIIVTSSIMKDMQPNLDVIYRPNAIRALCRITDVSVRTVILFTRLCMNSHPWSKLWSDFSKRQLWIVILPYHLRLWFLPITCSLYPKMSSSVGSMRHKKLSMRSLHRRSSTFLALPRHTSVSEAHHSRLLQDIRRCHLQVISRSIMHWGFFM